MFTFFAVLAVVMAAIRRAAGRRRYRGRHWTPVDDQWAAAIRAMAGRRKGVTTWSTY